MIILTIVNTIAIIYILTHKQFSLHINTIFGGTVVGYGFYYNRKRYFYMPIRNKKKAEVKYDVDRLINADYQQKRQTLGAMFSWLKTIAEVEQFEKDYAIIDRKIVDELVTEFKVKHQQ